MDDFNVSSLHESKNEWSSRLLTILTPLLIEGYKSILDESIKLCKENDEMNKYLMTFQNLISRIPKWNQTIIDNECKRICDKSGCVYLEDLITCVHIIQLKILTSMRVGQKQKKIDINIPNFNDFLHKAYINTARKLYKNVYLFEIDSMPLQAQKNNREIEIIVQECILNTIRESIPVETILKAYMDETIEEDVTEEIKEEIIENPVKPEPQVVLEKETVEVDKTHLQFDNVDYVKDTNNVITSVEAPKTIERLQEISNQRYNERNAEDEDDENDSRDRINISTEPIILTTLDIQNLEEPTLNLELPSLIDDVEVLF
uniref:Uncharacterized protein n=1 Tax=viral metagenome TaxID=1070528 RepID=A0A6C0LIL5_9ZZZZ